MRSALSAGARRWVTIVTSLRSVRGRSARLAIALFAAGVSVALVAIASSACGSGGGALGSPAGPSGPLALIGPIVGGSPGSASTLYRVVGCRSHGEVAYRHGPSRHVVAIGFDDGPDRDTPAFVRMLVRAHAHATFFVIGRQITAGYRATMLRELREGDVLGDHTFTHPDLTRTPDVRGQLQSTIGAIRTLTGYTPCVFRPPYGDYNASVVRTARSLGLATVTWNVDPSDYTQPGTRRDRAAGARAGPARLDHHLPRRRRAARADAGRLSGDHRRAAAARLRDRHDPPAARLPAHL